MIPVRTPERTPTLSPTAPAFFSSRAAGALPERLMGEIARVEAATDGFFGTIREIRLRAGRRSSLFVGGRTVPLSVVLSDDEVTGFVRTLSGGSLYAYRDCLSEGYLPLDDGSRAGISGDFFTEGGRVVGVRRVRSVVIRVARAVRVAAGKGLLKTEDFPLLCHVDEILTDKKPVNIPWEKFTFERQ